MQRFAVFPVLLACLVLADSLHIPTIPDPKTADEAITALNVGAAMGRSSINVALSLALVKTNLNLELTVAQKNCIRNGIQDVRRSTLAEIDSALDSFVEIVKGWPTDNIAALWSQIKDQLFGDDGIVGQIRENVKDSIDNLNDSCTAEDNSEA